MIPISVPYFSLFIGIKSIKQEVIKGGIILIDKMPRTHFYSSASRGRNSNWNEVPL